MSSTAVLYPIISALVVSEKELGANRTWTAVNEKQEQFLRLFETSRVEVAKIPEIESVCSHSHETINSFLKSKGFSIQLQPFNPVDIGVASVLKLVLEWAEKGSENSVMVEGNPSRFPAVYIKKKGVTCHKSAGHAHPIAQLHTTNGDEVFLTAVDAPVPQDQLTARAESILSGLSTTPEAFAGVIFPMVDLDHQPDISFLLNMHTVGSDGIGARIAQALQQTQFAMDEIGAVVKSAVAMHMTRCAVLNEADPIIINRPFLAMVRRPGLKQLIFVGYMDVDCWKRPKRE